jgi:hypothetical protein
MSTKPGSAPHHRTPAELVTRAITPHLVQSLYASAMWRLRQRFRLCVANVTVHRFPTALGTTKPKNPDIAVCFLEREEVLAFCGDRALELEPKNVAARFAEGEIFIASLDGDILAGYEWYRTTPACLEPGTVYFRFEAPFIYCAYSFTHPHYRGRQLSADRWDFAHREFSAEGWRGTVYYVETRNFASRRAGAKRTAKQRVGQFTYIRVMGRYIRWTSRGCRKLGIRLTGEPCASAASKRAPMDASSTSSNRSSAAN